MLKRIIKSVTVAVTIACLFVCLVPVQAFADPVSATIIANSFAQAIAAYGAANGVSMTFDVSNTSSIGESVHELWKDFREGTQDADDYATLASALFPDLYYKAATAVGTGSDIYTVGYNISAEYAEEFDNFYNWLLSGPAEMVQVDNQYYQFSSSAIGPDAEPITVYGYGDFSGQPIYQASSVLSNTVSDFELATPGYKNGYYYRSFYVYPVTSGDYSSVYMFFVPDGDYGYVYLVSSAGSMYARKMSRSSSNNSVSQGSNLTIANTDSTTGLLYVRDGVSGNPVESVYIPSYTTASSGFLSVASWIQSPVYSHSVGVKAYDNSGIADIPDTADPNYDALNRAREIPTDIPWDDTLYGDGSGTLTDAQTEAIASDVDLALVEDGVIELVEEGVEPAPTPNEVVIPFLPVGLPSFNFSFSGIWHYVREWVTSLGAWFATLFTIWSALPYAMVVPVYATAVVVIVLGVYKRFFM